MEFLIGLGVLVLFALLATRFGYDSRPALHSSEHDLASRGVVWPRKRSSAPTSAGDRDAQVAIATPASSETVSAVSTVEKVAA